ncbi:hypothetical protein SAMN05880593_13445 [Rhizobium sp. RU36D]|nr:hypothetical protein SAMN05880593_13445 [Rhizobium sp. RU36D]
MFCSAPVNHPESRRLVVELTSVYVACDDCGRSSVLRMPEIMMASRKGVQTYQELCQRFRCAECPPLAPAFRNLTIRPTWLDDSSYGRVKDDLVN